MGLGVDTALELGERLDGQAEFAHNFKRHFDVFRTAGLVDRQAARVTLQVSQYLHDLRGVEVHADQAGRLPGQPVCRGPIFVSHDVQHRMFVYVFHDAVDIHEKVCRALRRSLLAQDDRVRPFLALHPRATDVAAHRDIIGVHTL